MSTVEIATAVAKKDLVVEVVLVTEVAAVSLQLTTPQERDERTDRELIEIRAIRANGASITLLCCKHESETEAETIEDTFIE